MNSSGNTPPAGLSPEPFLIFYSHCPYKTPHSIRYVISLLAGGICERVIFGGGGNLRVAKPRVKFSHQSPRGFTARVHGFAAKQKHWAQNSASYAGLYVMCGRIAALYNCNLAVVEITLREKRCVTTIEAKEEQHVTRRQSRNDSRLLLLLLYCLLKLP